MVSKTTHYLICFVIVRLVISSEFQSSDTVYNCWEDASDAAPHGYELATWDNDWEYVEAIWAKANIQHAQRRPMWTGIFYVPKDKEFRTGRSQTNPNGLPVRWDDDNKFQQLVINSAVAGLEASVHPELIPETGERHQLPGPEPLEPISPHSARYKKILKEASESILPQSNIDSGNHNAPQIPSSDSWQSSYEAHSESRAYDIQRHLRIDTDADVLNAQWNSFFPAILPHVTFKKEQQFLDGRSLCGDDVKPRLGFAMPALYRRTRRSPRHWPNVYRMYSQIPDQRPIPHEQWYEAINHDCPGGIKNKRSRKCRDNLFLFLKHVQHNTPIQQVAKYGLNERDWSNWRKAIDIITANIEMFNVYNEKNEDLSSSVDNIVGLNDIHNDMNHFNEQQYGMHTQRDFINETQHYYDTLIGFLLLVCGITLMIGIGCMLTAMFLFVGGYALSYLDTLKRNQPTYEKISVDEEIE